MPSRRSRSVGAASASQRMAIRDAGNRWSWFSRRLPGPRPRVVAVLAVTGCAAACLAAAGGTAASGSVAVPGSVAVAGSVAPGAAAVRFGALRAAPGGAGQAALARLGNAVQSGPGRRGGSVVLGGSPGNPVANPKTGTVYVPIQCATSFCPAAGKPGHLVDVINAARC